MKGITEKVYKTSYAWTRKLKSFTDTEPNPDETLCAWCGKSQTQILNEHIEQEDQQETEV